MLEKINSFFAQKWKARICGIFVLIIILTLAFPALRLPGHIVFGDLDIGFTLRGYIDHIFPLWNPTWSTSTFFNGTRLPFVAVLYSLVLLFGDFPSIFQKLIFLSLLCASAVGMFLLVFDLLRQEILGGKARFSYGIAFVIALGSGIYYSYNPWSIVRIQHIYLLVGYALLPFIFYTVLTFTRDLSGAIFRLKTSTFVHIFLASLFYAIAIGAVHYLFFTFFLIGGWYFYLAFFLIIQRKFRELAVLTYRFVLFGGMFLILISYWLIPYMHASSIASVNPPSINTLDSIIGLARYSTFKNVLLLQSYWWPAIDIDNLSDLFYLSGFLIVGIILLGNIFHLKNKLVVFFLLWSGVFIILSTGTKTPYFAALYKWIVFDNPAAGSVGFIFRDANKLIGLLAFGFAILWAYGTAGIINFFARRLELKKTEIAFLSQVFDRVMTEDKNMKKRFNPHILFLTASIIIFGVSYYYYAKPYYESYLQHAYEPIPIPKDYTDLIEYEKKDSSPYKYLYLPRYEGIVTPGYEFAVSKWNLTTDPQRSTSSFDIHTTIKDTYNPLEGSTTILGYFYEYLNTYLKSGIGTKLADYLEILGIQRLVYHDDLYRLDEMQQTQISNIEKQDMIKKGSIGFFHMYDTKNPYPYAQYYKNNIFYFGGLSTFETLLNSDVLEPKTYANIFVNANPEINTWKSLSHSGDILITDSRLDTILSLLDKKDLLAPFDNNNYSDAFSRWAKNKEDSPDWLYHLGKLGIKNFSWDFAINKGFIYTYAPAMLDMEPYEYIHDKGVDQIDFQHITDLNEIFTSSDTGNLKLLLEKKDSYASLPAVKGEITKGNSTIWKIGSFRPFTAKEKTAYTFEVVVSGKNVNQIHGKVKFLDQNNKEIGLSYVSAPRYANDFELIKFSGSFITPVGTKQLLFELGSLQNPEQKSFWWIHDMKMKSLSAYTKPNIQMSTYTFSVSGSYKVFVRTFDNIKGGNIKIGVDESMFDFSTKTNNRNSFSWHYLGNIDRKSAGKTQVTIENIDGFNAVNVLAFVREDEYAKLASFLKNTDVKQVIATEAEKFTDFSGNIQSNTFDTRYSNGRSLQFDKGRIFYPFDILKKADYSFSLNIKNGDKNTLSIDPKAAGEYQVILRRGSKILSTNTYLPLTTTISLPKIFLTPGAYSLEIKIIDHHVSILKTEDFNRFSYNDPSLDKTTIFFKGDAFMVSEQYKYGGIHRNIPRGKTLTYLEDEQGCSYFAGLENSFVKENLIETPEKTTKQVTLLPGYSCFWLIHGNNPISVLPKNEYLLSFGIKKSDTKKLHAKLVFYNREKKLIPNAVIEVNNENILQNQLDGFDTSFTDSTEYQQNYIIKTPEQAYFFSLQFWQKQRQDIASSFEISNISLKNYNELPGIDSIVIADGKILQKGVHYPISFSRDGAMAGTLSIPENTGTGIIIIEESFNPLWQAKIGKTYTKPVIANIFLDGYFGDFSHEREVILTFMPSKFLPVGFILAGLLFLGSSMFLFFSRKKQ